MFLIGDNTIGISSEVCKDAILAKSLSLIHTVFSIICIAGPIILIIMASIQTASMMMNPDQKNGTKKIINKFVAAIIIFFLPMVTDIVMGFIPGNEFSISSCWNAADEASENIEFSTFSNPQNSGNGIGGNLAGLATYAGISSNENSGSDGSGESGGSMDCKRGKIIPGGNPVPLYYQNHPDCDYGAFNSSETLANSGCGFTSMAMILSYLTSNYITPQDMATKYKNYFVPGAGMSWGLPGAAARDYGLPEPEVVTVMMKNKDKFISALKAGKIILIRGTNYEQFSQGPHLMVLRGVDDHDNIFVNNPTYGLDSTTPVTFAKLNMWGTRAWIFEAKKTTFVAPSVGTPIAGLR